jgi:hypothetical protein
MENTNTTASKRRIRRDQEEWRDLIAQFERNGQTRDQFCAEHNLGISTFSRWRQRLRQAIPPLCLTMARRYSSSWNHRHP